MAEIDIQAVDSHMFVSGIELASRDIHPYVVYSTLKGILGEPKREEEFENEEEPENEFVYGKWYWHIKLFDDYLTIYGYATTWYMKIWTADEQIAKETSTKFTDFIRKQAPKYLAQLRKLASATSGFVLQNPYAIYYHDAKKLLAKANEVKDSEWAAWTTVQKQRSDLYTSAFFLFIASFEGFLNLIYELYLKPSLRDERIYSRLLREQIDVKLRLAPVYCLCFKDEVIDHRTEPFQRLQYIADLRNDFIHANITKPMRIPVVKEDKYYFDAVNEFTGKYGLPRSVVELDIQHIKFVQQTIDDMVEIVIGAMKPHYHAFQYIVQDWEFYVEIVDDEYIIIDY
jgi:hypothetical protein